jgi:hypothetical protein
MLLCHEFYVTLYVILHIIVSKCVASIKYSGADKTLYPPTSRSRRTEAIVSFERGVCSCAELQDFSCYRS